MSKHDFAEITHTERKTYIIEPLDGYTVEQITELLKSEEAELGRHAITMETEEGSKTIAIVWWGKWKDYKEEYEAWKCTAEVNEEYTAVFYE